MLNILRIYLTMIRFKSISPKFTNKAYWKQIKTHNKTNRSAECLRTVHDDVT